VSNFAVFVLPEAEAEIGAAYLWYHERNPLAADSFRSEVFDLIDALDETADRWKLDSDGNRRCVMKRFPYTIHAGTVYVLALAHQRREPGYWRIR
jgi:hypothetical protein